MTETSQQGRVAVVTGGSRGIGRAIANRLSAEGFAVGVGFASRKEEADAVVAAIEASGGAAAAFQVDVSEESSVGEAFDAVEARWGGLDVVVNSAGVMTNAPVVAGDLEALDRMIAVNLRGAFIVAAEAARRVREGGSIVLLSSSVVRLRPPTYAAYAATKAAVDVLTAIAAKELGPRGVTVNAIAPGPVETELFHASNTPESIAMLTHMTPLGRIGVPDDVVAAVSLLAGEGRWITGQTLHVNGGLA
ncbi:SDR family oxidoreductase [Demequina sp. TTPB684]|uniref:SDR family oxidoreductase n=1 Tax=unclassified Demequina TaxID=2620311 RepID=UPI001CF1B217|nr:MULTISPECIES: SDR family oxidoreductase [unclassified Demequina]MCB2413978.1 SDR family oxidoreductase [Demequina sp. TTPB684]UPU88669.1 SDR family oxidoreductase [Demequina sp. TMPB413]